MNCSRNLIRLMILVAVVFSVVSCNRPSGPVISSAEQGNYAGVKDNDQEINSAISRARNELDSFINQLQHPKEGQDFGIKAGLPTDSGGTEHIWVSGLTYENGTFHGRLANDPFEMKSLKVGSPVSFTRDQVTDWTVFQNGQPVQGGYTTAILERRGGG